MEHSPEAERDRYDWLAADGTYHEVKTAYRRGEPALAWEHGTFGTGVRTDRKGWPRRTYPYATVWAVYPRAGKVLRITMADLKLAVDVLLAEPAHDYPTELGNITPFPDGSVTRPATTYIPVEDILAVAGDKAEWLDMELFGVPFGL